jgi:hypothetical protein
MFNVADEQSGRHVGGYFLGMVAKKREELAKGKK